MDQQYQIAEGTNVVGADGDKVGKVVAVQGNYIVVEKGFFFPTDFYIPTSAIASADGDNAYLSVTKDEALNQGWDTVPTDDAYTTTTTTATTYDTTTVPTGRSRAGLTPDTEAFEHRQDTQATHVNASDTLRVPVHEEELTAVTREREVGEVEITKGVVAEEQTLEVPVTEERVRVQRRAVDRDATADGTAFQGGTIEVPLMGEEVELQKRTHVSEEIEIGKEAVQHTEQVSGTVRREVVDVQENVVDVDTAATAQTSRNKRNKR